MIGSPKDNPVNPVHTVNPVEKTGCWLPVSAPGVTPEDGAEYTLRFKFDYKKGTYSVETGSSCFRATNRTENFPLAASTTAVSSIAFDGDTDFTSLVDGQAIAKEFGAGRTITRWSAALALVGVIHYHSLE